jgi:hypothetical protein
MKMAEFIEMACVFVGIPVGFLVIVGLLDRVFGEWAAKVMIWIVAIVIVGVGAAVWCENPRHPSSLALLLRFAFEIAAITAICLAGYIAAIGVCALIGRVCWPSATRQ